MDRVIEAAWARLLSLAVHEFRTPVTVVGGYVRLLLSERAGPLAPGQRRILEEIQKSCGRLSTLLAELGDLASLETGKAVLQRGRVELGRLVDEVVA
ncbi:MAG TPA: histidine kinase dimerization/phospho-acceptor domain-containing protein, partial [Vicinamibacterales bacterium]|nr:histidine kinase dimerization/phospho-acceptor domain-containing protein [Vicinamibacterales bacterium]